MVVTPSRSVLVIVIDVSVPEPVTVAPAGRFGHEFDESAKLTGNVSIVAPPFAAIALVTPTASATTVIVAAVSRFPFDLLPVYPIIARSYPIIAAGLCPSFACVRLPETPGLGLHHRRNPTVSSGRLHRAWPTS